MKKLNLHNEAWFFALGSSTLPYDLAIQSLLDLAK